MDKYVLIDQMKTFLALAGDQGYKNGSELEEYKQVQIIFQCLVNSVNEKSYKKLMNILVDVSAQIKTPRGTHSQMYWSKFLIVLNELIMDSRV